MSQGSEPHERIFVFAVQPLPRSDPSTRADISKHNLAISQLDPRLLRGQNHDRALSAPAMQTARLMSASHASHIPPCSLVPCYGTSSTRWRTVPVVDGQMRRGFERRFSPARLWRRWSAYPDLRNRKRYRIDHQATRVSSSESLRTVVAPLGRMPAVGGGWLGSHAARRRWRCMEFHSGACAGSVCTLSRTVKLGVGDQRWCG